MFNKGDKVKVRGSNMSGVIIDITQEFRNTNRHKVTVYYVEIEPTKQIMHFTHDEIKKLL